MKLDPPVTITPASLTDRVAAGAFLFCAGAMGVVTALWPLGFSALAAVTGLCLLPNWRSVRSCWPVFLALGVLVIYAALRAYGSAYYATFGALRSYKAIEQQTWIKLILQYFLYSAVVLGAAQLSVDRGRKTLNVLAVSTLIAAGAFAMEALDGARGFMAVRSWIGEPIRPDFAVKKVAEASHGLALLIWPLSLVLAAQHRWRAILFLWAAEGLGSILTGASASVIAIASGLLVFAFVRAAPRWAPTFCGAAAAIKVLLAPMIVSVALQKLGMAWVDRHLPLSWSARVHIWQFASARIFERPLAGYGLDASRMFGAAIPLHTHNFAQQVWLELGSFGAVILAIVVFLLYRCAGKISGANSVSAAAASGLVTTWFAISSFSFGVWQEWWLGLAALSAAFMVVAVKVRADEMQRLDDQLDFLSLETLK